jgi:hypothetical protein
MGAATDATERGADRRRCMGRGELAATMGLAPRSGRRTNQGVQGHRPGVQLRRETAPLRDTATLWPEIPPLRGRRPLPDPCEERSCTATVYRAGLAQRRPPVAAGDGCGGGGRGGGGPRVLPEPPPRERRGEFFPLTILMFILYQHKWINKK